MSMQKGKHQSGQTQGYSQRYGANNNYLNRPSTPQRQGTDVNFQLTTAPYPPQQGGGSGPPGGPLRMHHNHHGGNPLPHQQQPQQQGQHSGGPPGPAPTSTPPGHGDMNKGGPGHLQGQPQIQAPIQVGYPVPNHSRPGGTHINSQNYFQGPRGPPPRIPRQQVVNISGNGVQQQALFTPPMHVFQSPQLVSTPLPASQQMIYPMFQTGQPRHQHNASGYAYQHTQQQFIVATPQLSYQGFPTHAQQGPQYYYQSLSMAPAGPGGRPTVAGPGMAAGTPQQVVTGGPPPHQMQQTGQMPISMMSGGLVVPQIANENVNPVQSNSSMKQSRRKHALDIVDPKTMTKVSVYDESNGSTPPRSGDSSARETPQLNTGADAMDVAADFAARVAKAASEDSSVQSQIIVQPPYSKSPAPTEPQIVNLNGPDLNTNTLPPIVDQPDLIVNEVTIVDVPPAWQQQPVQPQNIGAKFIKSDSVTKTDIKIESDDNSNVIKAVVNEPVISDLTYVPSVSVISKDIQQIDTLSHSPTPVVSALTDNPSVELHHRSREQFPTSKSVTGTSLPNAVPALSSPRRRVKDNTLDKHNIPNVPSMPVNPIPVASIPVVDTRPCETELPSIPSQTIERVQKSPSPVPLEETISVPMPPPKEKREERTQRDREKTSQTREVIQSRAHEKFQQKEPRNRSQEKILPSQEKEKVSQSQSRERDTSSLSKERDKQSSFQGRPKDQVTLPSVEPISLETPHMIPIPNISLPPATNKSLQAASSVAPVEIKQTNGDVAVETTDGRATQRSKPKRQKMKDYNKIGAGKEGTDMDAFVEPSNEVSPVATPASQPSPVPSPAPTVQVQVTAPTVPTPAPPVQSNKTIETTLAKEPEQEEETEVEKSDEEKIVAARNEENAKEFVVSEEDVTPVIENNSNKSVHMNTKLKYKDDQWSPVNPSGKKKYERDFLMELQNEPACRKKPENFPNLDILLLRDNSNKQQQQQRIMDPRSMMNMRSQHDAFAPGFMRSGGSVSRGMPAKRNSQQKPKPSNKPHVIHVSLSLKDDVKLHETENAWKPAHLKPSQSDYSAKTEELYKKFRGILNKLTPEKFNKLVKQVQSLPIDNPERLQGVINLVFEKAVDEPNFSEAYAQMCKVLSNLEVPQNKESSTENVNFRKLLVSRCQAEFEKNSEAELNRDEKLKEIEETVDPEKKKELQLLYEEEERKIRMKSVGNIRFIGELYKLHMLTANIMQRCIVHLLSQCDEESLECLCKLLTTIGKDLEARQDLTQYFNKMKELSGKRGEISSRVRFMLQDVIELRQSKWVPRRDESAPKTIDQIQKEAEKENLDMQIALSAAPPPRRQDDRGIGGGSIDRRKNRGGSGMSEDGWAVATGRSSTTRYTLDTNKMRINKEMTETTQLGSRSLFTNWKSGVAAAKSETEKKMNYNNYYSALQQEPQHEEKRLPLSVSQSTSSTGKVLSTPSLEKERQVPAFRPSEQDSRVSSSNLQQSRSSSRDDSVRRSNESLPTPVQISVEDLPVRNNKQEIITNTQNNNSNIDMDEQQIEKETHMMLAEFLQNISYQDAEQNVSEAFSENTFIPFIRECMNYILEKSSQSRLSVAKLMCHLIKKNTINKIHYISGVVEFLGFADDYAIDVPKFWSYVAESIAPLLSEEVLSFVDFNKIVTDAKTSELVTEVLSFLIKDKGPDWIREKYEASKVQLVNMGSSDILNFMKQNNLGPTDSSELSMNEIEAKLLQFLTPNEEQESSVKFEQICSWIEANVGERVSEPRFIRALSTAVCRSAIYKLNSTWKLKTPLLTKNGKLLIKYIDHKEDLELQCLFAVQAVIHELQHPQGLICQIFNTLWDEGILSMESFLLWEGNNDPQELGGKGVALKSLTQFFTTLKEADEDDDSCDDS